MHKFELFRVADNMSDQQLREELNTRKEFEKQNGFIITIRTDTNTIHVAAKCNFDAKQWVISTLETLSDQSISSISVPEERCAIAGVSIPKSPYRWLSDTNHAVSKITSAAIKYAT